ncbi:MAG: AraC family transcriptional regulator [Clostridia bacterium]|nr:AraC family transcriptional regulator [Clostridia bacterium]
MDWIQAILKAVNYIEKNINQKIDYEKVAKQAYSSCYHFQKVFSITCGFTLGEYIRRRKLTLAGKDLLNDKLKVIDVAYKYGYETPESFSRAFYKYHGIMPSKVKNCSQLKIFPPLTTINKLNGETKMNYKMKEIPEKVLVGYKTRFTGAPYGEERLSQEHAFLTSTRAKQWLLLGASSDYTTDYLLINNVDDNGYDFYVAYELDEWTRENLFNKKVTGVDFIEKMDFETIVIPNQTYAVFETEKKKYPILDYTEIRKQIVTNWLPNSNYIFDNTPEIVAIHWRPKGEWEKERYVEILLPIKTKNEQA